MKKLNLIAGIIFFVGPIFLIEDDLKNYRIEKYGKIVRMEIIDLPGSCLGTRTKHYMKVQYEGRIFMKRIPSGYCESHQTGEMVEIKYLEEMDRVLLPNENVIKEFIFEGISMIFGLYIFLRGFKKT